MSRRRRRARTRYRRLSFVSCYRVRTATASFERYGGVRAKRGRDGRASQRPSTGGGGNNKIKYHDETGWAERFDDRRRGARIYYARTTARERARSPSVANLLATSLRSVRVRSCFGAFTGTRAAACVLRTRRRRVITPPVASPSTPPPPPVLPHRY